MLIILNRRDLIRCLNDKEKTLIRRLEVNDKMVVTSGNYERYFEKDGVRYHHILSPFTAMPADMGIISSTIVTDKSIDADALSTATYNGGVYGLPETANFLMMFYRQPGDLEKNLTTALATLRKLAGQC